MASHTWPTPPSVSQFTALLSSCVLFSPSLIVVGYSAEPIDRPIDQCTKRLDRPWEWLPADVIDGSLY
jgi:hypothetical protein